MKDEIQTIAGVGLPAKTVNQYGEKNVHIDTAENVTQNININFPYVQRMANGTMQPTSRVINPEYYNLFVIGNETFEYDHFIVPADRALSRYWTSEELRERYGTLSETAVEAMKTFPALFMPEAEFQHARAGENQQVFFGFVDGIRKQDNGVKIRCQLLWPIPMQQISNIGFELGMLDMTRGISEMNHTHWAIKHINLKEELADAKISLFGF